MKKDTVVIGRTRVTAKMILISVNMNQSIQAARVNQEWLARIRPDFVYQKKTARQVHGVLKTNTSPNVSITVTNDVTMIRIVYLTAGKVVNATMVMSVTQDQTGNVFLLTNAIS